MEAIDQIQALYAESSKHSNYQVLPKRLEALLQADVNVKSRYEQERLDFILETVDIKNKSVLDIGGNTGFFSFELIENGADKVHYYEGNKVHCEFVKLASVLLNVEDKVRVTNNYFSFENERETYDLILLLNVLHHFGDDYGDSSTSIENAKSNIVKQLNSLADKTHALVFQLGFNWKGNRNLGLFENGTKPEMIDFIKKGIEKYWRIENIGIAEKTKPDTITYLPPSESNLKRNDSLGEFLNRPIFILKSLIKKNDFNPDDEKVFLNSLVKDYTDMSPYSKTKKDIIHSLINDFISDEGYKKVIQLGCSNGYETNYLSGTFKNVTVIDGSSKFINNLKENNTNKNVDFVFDLFETFRINQKDDLYDYVFCNYVLEHVFSPVEVLSNVRNVLKKDGLLFAVVPNANAFSRKLAQSMDLIKNLKDLTENDHKHGHRRVYDHEQIKKDFLQSGFEIVLIKGIILKILSDFQLNKMIDAGIISDKHIWALQKMGEDMTEYCDSIFVVARPK